MIYHGSVLNMPTDVKIVSDHSADSRNEISSRELVYTHFIIHIPRRVRFGLRAARGGGGRRRHRRCAPTAPAGRAQTKSDPPRVCNGELFLD